MFREEFEFEFKTLLFGHFLFQYGAHGIPIVLLIAFILVGFHYLLISEIYFNLSLIYLLIFVYTKDLYSFLLRRHSNDGTIFTIITVIGIRYLVMFRKSFLNMF